MPITLWSVVVMYRTMIWPLVRGRAAVAVVRGSTAVTVILVTWPVDPRRLGFVAPRLEPGDGVGVLAAEQDARLARGLRGLDVRVVLGLRRRRAPVKSIRECWHRRARRSGRRRCRTAVGVIENSSSRPGMTSCLK